MKLEALVEAVVAELEDAGLEPATASLSLAFSAREEADGSVRCEFADAASLSRPRTGEQQHRLDVTLSGSREKTGSKDDRAETKARRPVSIEDHDHDGDLDDLDTPAIFRIKLAQEG